MSLMTSMPDPSHRGSRKHVLDWVRSPDFRDELNTMIAASGVRVRLGDLIMPTGEPGKAGIREARLERFLPDGDVCRALQRWWLAAPRGANTPNWDLAALTEHKGRPALVLVEAKANHPELSRAGKPVPRAIRRRSVLIEPSANSWANHARVAEAISEAENGINRLLPGFSLSRDRNYQISNRLAFSWKLASLGIPTVLLYLGFTGDRGLEPTRPMLRDASDWNRCFAARTENVIPRGAAGRWIEVGPAGFMLLVSSRKRLEDSPPLA